MPPKRIIVKPPPPQPPPPASDPESCDEDTNTNSDGLIVVHLADLHIRCGTLATSRYDEYATVFDRIIAAITDLKNNHNNNNNNNNNNNKLAIVIAGDVFHSKLKIESPGLKLAIRLLTALGQLAPTFIIAGNHDISQINPTEPDLIGVLAATIPNIHYLNTTQYHRPQALNGQLGIGTVAIQDAIQRGGTASEPSKSLPDFPPIPVSITQRAPINIALFHGPVTGTILANGTQLDNIASGDTYPASWMTSAGYTNILLGDIHLPSVSCDDLFTFDEKHKKPGKPFPQKLGEAKLLQSYAPLKSNHPVLVYPGSPIQQNHGEPLIGHGFMVWELFPEHTNRPPKIHHYHVPNDYGLITVDMDTMTTRLHHQSDNSANNANTIPLADALAETQMPAKLSVRVKTSSDMDYVNLPDLKAIFEASGKEVTQVIRMPLPLPAPPMHSPENEDNVDNNGQIQPISSDPNVPKLAEFETSLSLQSMNTPAAWHAYTVESNANANLNVNVSLEWFTHPETLSIPNQDEPGLTAHVGQRNAKIDKRVREYEQLANTILLAPSQKGGFRLRHIEFDWILCYRDGNYFSFDSLSNSHMNNKIVAISARNGMGKTSFLETVCIALFGEGFPSRKVANTNTKQQSMICSHIPDDATPTTTIYVDATQATYRIRRNFSANANVNQAAQVERVQINPTTNIAQVLDANVAVGRPATNQWVQANLGTLDEFLLSTMITQNSDMDFFALKGQEQREMLDKALNIDTSTAFHAVLKESKLAHAATIDALKVLIDSMQHQSQCPVTQDHIQELETQHAQLAQETQDLKHRADTLKQELNQLPKIDNPNTNKDLLELELEPESQSQSLSQSLSTDDIQSYNALKQELNALNIAHVLDEYERPDDADLADMAADAEEAAIPMTLEAIEKELATLPNPTPDADDTPLTQDQIQQAQDMRDALMADPVPKPPVLVGPDVVITIPEPFPNDDSRQCEGIPEITRAQYNQFHQDYVTYKAHYDPDYVIPEADAEDSLPSLLKELATLKVIKAIEPFNEANTSNESNEASEASHWIWHGPNDPIVNHDCAVCRSRVRKYKPTPQIDPTLKKAHRKWHLLRQIAAHLHNQQSYHQDQLSLIQRQEQYQQHERDIADAKQRLQAQQDTAKWRDYQQQLQHTQHILKRAQLEAAQIRRQQLEEWQQQETTRRLIKAWRLLDRIHALEAMIIARKRAIAKELERLVAELAVKDRALADLGLDLHDKRRIIAHHAQQQLVYTKRQAALIELQTRAAAITQTYETFGQFKSWLYTHRVLPQIARIANGIMSTMCHCDRPLYLQGESNATTNTSSADALSWSLIDGAVKAPIEKASGFQRFIAGIAVRLALGRLMSNTTPIPNPTSTPNTSNTPAQLFVDEGFVACDQENRSRVGDFLRALPHQQIILVSHLEDVNQCANKHVTIERGPFDQQSLLQVGRAIRRLAVAQTAAPEKKVKAPRTVVKAVKA